jgi:hypothetical protein
LAKLFEPLQKKKTFLKGRIFGGKKMSPPRHEWSQCVGREVLKQGCQIFLGTKYRNGDKYTKLPQNIPNDHKIYRMTIKYLE